MYKANLVVLKIAQNKFATWEPSKRHVSELESLSDLALAEIHRETKASSAT